MIEWRLIEKLPNGTRYRKFADGKPTNNYKLELGADPTLDLSVGASSDDAFEYYTGVVDIDDAWYNIDDAGEYAGFRWTGVNIPSGATIGTAYMSVYVLVYDDPRVYIHCQDANNPSTFVAENGNIRARSLTTEKATWNADNIGTGAFKNSPSLTDVIQEVVDDNSGTGDALVVIWDCFSPVDFGYYTYDQGDHSNAPTIHIEYTTAAAFIPKITGLI